MSYNQFNDSQGRTAKYFVTERSELLRCHVSNHTSLPVKVNPYSKQNTVNVTPGPEDRLEKMRRKLSLV
ncbi:hypothetical protein Hamer_G007324 [Homarus americanus]|uniref:Uncharacterized protein n=1 Tax=Homarus americanus TaxID=6706 RepID=A0A8J5K2M5_HOMAM|nr:hypothetical protein Hamer_G007324 [Homarus americanus]